MGPSPGRQAGKQVVTKHGNIVKSRKKETVGQREECETTATDGGNVSSSALWCDTRSQEALGGRWGGGGGREKRGE